MSRTNFSEPDDVPTGVDFHDPTHARKWTEETPIKRPFRPRFFAAFCAALEGVPRPRVLELGSGPGHLAREILTRCAPREYIALDFSEPMHALAREYLGPLAAAVTFVTRDFRDPHWPDGLGTFDAVVTMQAAHETRNIRHVQPLLERARSVLGPGGLLLYCDSYVEPGRNPALFLDREEQPRALERAGLSNVARLLDENGLALYTATAPTL